MFKLKKFNKAIVGSVITLVLVSGIYAAKAADFVIPQQFNPGDVISADVMNEVFDYIAFAQKVIQPSDLVGTWQCDHSILYDKTLYSDMSYHYSPNIQYYDSTFTPTQSGYFLHKIEPLIIANNNDGTVLWTSPKISLLAPWRW